MSETLRNKSELAFNNVHIYGRDDELARLKEAYHESCRAIQIVWLYGYSGVGKTTLVQLALQGAEHYCHGKFDRLRSGRPYSAIVDVLSRLCFILEFGYPTVQVSPDVALILSRIIPDVSHVLSFEKSDETPGDFEQNFDLPNCRLELGFEKLKHAVWTFLRGSCEVIGSLSNSPLVLFLDDLQWADEDSIQIIKSFLTGGEMRGLLFIGSYRDNEVGIDSPLMLCKRSICDLTKQITEIEVSNLTRSSIDQLVADVTNMPLALSEPLGEQVYTKTLGNPFFALRVLRRLHETHLLEYSNSRHGWEWKADKIHEEVEMSDNVVAFMVQTLSSLPAETTEVLKIASCLGSSVDMVILEYVVQGLDFDFDLSLKEMLEVAVSAHLIVIDSDATSFKFAHDRIHDAAYSLTTPGTMRKLMHLRIGRRLQSMIVEDQPGIQKEHVVLTVNQMNRGINLIVDNEEKVELTRLNLMAAEEVISTSAFKMANNFLETGIELLGSRRWSENYELTLAITNMLGFVLFNIGLMDDCLRIVDQIYDQSACQEDSYKAQFLHVEVLASLNQLDACLDAGMSILFELGHPKLPRNPSLVQIIPAIVRVKMLLRNKDDAYLLSLPRCEDKKILSIMQHLAYLCPVSYFSDRQEMIGILTCRMMQLSLRHGVSDFSPYAFACWGFAMTVTRNFDEAFRFATLALQLMRRFGEECRTIGLVHGLLYHLKKPILETTAPTLRAYHMAFSQGDLAYAGQASALYIAGRFVAGSPLEGLVADSFTICDELNAYNQIMMWNSMTTMQRTFLELVGRPLEMVRLTRAALDDNAFETFLVTSKAEMCLLSFDIFTTISRYYLGDMESALNFAERCWRSKGLKGAVVWAVSFMLFSALTALRHYKTLQTGPKRFRYWRVFCRNHREIQLWTNKGDPNTQHLAHLLDAERMVITHRDRADKIKRTYDKAIETASKGGFVQDAALANELAGIYFLSNRRNEKLASLYLARAKTLFTDWGATAKVRQMEAKYGYLASVADVSSD